MTYLVVVDKTADNKIAKMQEYPTRAEADAHVMRVKEKYPNAFVVDNYVAGALSHTTVDMTAKTIVYDKAGWDVFVANRTWHEDMAEADSNMMPRYAEDILDGMANKLSVPQITLDRLQAKKDLRATKP